MIEESPTLSKGLQNPEVNGINFMRSGVQSKTIKYIDRQENITHNRKTIIRNRSRNYRIDRISRQEHQNS